MPENLVLPEEKEMPKSLSPRNPPFRPGAYKTEEKLGGASVLLFSEF